MGHSTHIFDRRRQNRTPGYFVTNLWTNQPRRLDFNFWSFLFSWLPIQVIAEYFKGSYQHKISENLSYIKKSLGIYGLIYENNAQIGKTIHLFWEINARNIIVSKVL